MPERRWNTAFSGSVEESGTENRLDLRHRVRQSGLRLSAFPCGRPERTVFRHGQHGANTDSAQLIPHRSMLSGTVVVGAVMSADTDRSMIDLLSPMVATPPKAAIIRDMDILERLAGSWAFTMRHIAVAEPVTGMQRYHWVLGGAFLQQDWTYDHPDFPDGISILDRHSVRYFDVRGIARVFDLTLDEPGWSMIRRDDDFWQRSASRFVDDDTIVGTGELSYDEGASWRHDYAIECHSAN